MAVDLVYHASKGRSSTVRKLLEEGIHPDASNGNGETALFHAALSGKTGTAHVLLRYGADANKCSQNGLSPINAACIDDNVKTLALLINYGGRLQATDKDDNESAVVSAHKHRSHRVIKYITELKKEARMNYHIHDVGDVTEVDDAQWKQKFKKLTNRQEFPGNYSSIPCIDLDEIKTLHEGTKFAFTAPHVTYRSGTWHRIPVTTKRLNKVYYIEEMKREMDILRFLRHPHIVSLLAVITGPVPQHMSSVFDYFKLGNLHHVLHETDIILNLLERLHIMLDVANAMVYVHDKSIIHCYINSYSAFINENKRAKIGNFEHAHKTDENNGSVGIAHIVDQQPWMSCEQLKGYTVEKNGDVYSFGALFWECLTRRLPWSWLGAEKSIISAVCDEGQRLPLLKEWPDYVTEILKHCCGPEKERPDFVTLNKQLICIKTFGWTFTTDTLDNAFDMWYYGKRKISLRRKSGIRPLSAEISGMLSGFSVDSIAPENEDDYSKVWVLDSRRKSSMHAKVKRGRRNTVYAGLAGVMKGFHHSELNIRKERDTEKFGIEIAEQLDFVRCIWRKSKHHSRHRWAKEVATRRSLEGDIERLKVSAESKLQMQKAKRSKKGRRVRRLSHGLESIVRLRTIAGNYGKWNWARYTTGHDYFLPEDKYEMLSEEEYDDDEEEPVPMETAGTFVQYQGESIKDCEIVPKECRAMGLIDERTSSDEDSISRGLESPEQVVENESVEETVQQHWKKEDEGENEKNEDDNDEENDVKKKNNKYDHSDDDDDNNDASNSNHDGESGGQNGGQDDQQNDDQDRSQSGNHGNDKDGSKDGNHDGEQKNGHNDSCHEDEHDNSNQCGCQDNEQVNGRDYEEDSSLVCIEQVDNQDENQDGCQLSSTLGMMDYESKNTSKLYGSRDDAYDDSFQDDDQDGQSAKYFDISRKEDFLEKSGEKDKGLTERHETVKQTELMTIESFETSKGIDMDASAGSDISTSMTHGTNFNDRKDLREWNMNVNLIHSSTSAKWVGSGGDVTADITNETDLDESKGFREWAVKDDVITSRTIHQSGDKMENPTSHETNDTPVVSGAEDCLNSTVHESVENDNALESENMAVSPGAQSFSSAAANFLDEFTEWLDEYTKQNSPCSSVSSSIREFPSEGTMISRDIRELPGEGTVISRDNRELTGEGTVISRDIRELPGEGIVISHDMWDSPSEGTVISRNNRDFPGEGTVTSRDFWDFPSEGGVTPRDSQELPDEGTTTPRDISEKTSFEDLVEKYDSELKTFEFQPVDSKAGTPDEKKSLSSKADEEREYRCPSARSDT